MGADDCIANARGFSIIEAAVALFLLTLLFGTVFIPLETQVDTRKVENTERVLREAREALLGYAAARGYFPCPADASSGGREPPGSNHATGACPTYYGFLPAAELGLNASDGHGYAADAWGTDANRIRYAVSSQTVALAGNANAFTRVNGMRAAGIAALGDSSLSLFHVCSSGRGVVAGKSCGSTPTIVSTTPVVIWSSGRNAAIGGTSMDEAQNPNTNGGSADRIFVMTVRSNAPGNEFDDLVVWIPMPVLVARMVTSGQLP
jgi:type II secretory pathway pseudopilin PulG